MAAKQDPVSGLNYGWALGEDHKSALNGLKNDNIKQH